jgi:hypothetical protein
VTDHTTHHDSDCEAANDSPGLRVTRCRCEVRALEAKLAEAEHDAGNMRVQRAQYFERAIAAEAKLCALKPLVRGLMTLAESGDAASPLGRSICNDVRNLPPALREWAMTP